jgi:Lon protease-like protein
MTSNQQEMPLFPLNTVLFPGMALPLHIFEERYKLMINECVRDSRPFGVVLIRSGSELGDGATVYDVGTTAYITQVEPLGDGRMNIATLGYNRFRVHSTHNRNPYLTGIVEDFPLELQQHPHTKKLSAYINPMLRHYLGMFSKLGADPIELKDLPQDPKTLAFLTAILLRMPIKDKQSLLACPDLVKLLLLEIKMLRRETHILHILIDEGPKWRDDPRTFSPN